MQSVCFMYGSNLGGTALLRVQANDNIVMTHSAFHRAVAEGIPDPDLFESKLFRYVNAWGASNFRAVDSSAPTWFPCPGDAWPMPKIRAKAYPYMRHERFRHFWFQWMFGILRAFPDQAGVFIDDFRPEVDYWGLSPAEENFLKIMDEGSEAERLDKIEVASRALAALQRRRDGSTQRIVVNGTGNQKALNGPRLHESIGIWSKLDSPLIRPGDWVLINGLKADGASWAVTEPWMEASGGFSPGTSFMEIFSQALAKADDMGLGVALGYHERPRPGASKLSVHSYTDPSTWNQFRKF